MTRDTPRPVLTKVSLCHLLFPDSVSSSQDFHDSQ
jgi:hypothetical protein